MSRRWECTEEVELGKDEERINEAEKAREAVLFGRVRGCGGRRMKFAADVAKEESAMEERPDKPLVKGGVEDSQKSRRGAWTN